MSIRTIIEINHDWLYLLEKDPDIMKKISRLIQDYYTHSAGSDDSVNWPTGIRILGARHHTDTLKLTVK
jgi:hypothetical protein